MQTHKDDDDSSGEEDNFVNTWFEEPKDFRPPVCQSQVLQVILTKHLYFTVNLIGEHSLWAHVLWNSSRSISRWFTLNSNNRVLLPHNKAIDVTEDQILPDFPILYTVHPTPPVIADKCVLELGAGGALPSMTSLFMGARRVLCTDYPEKQILDHTHQTFIDNFGKSQYDELVKRGTLEIRGHVWGQTDQLQQLSDSSYDDLGRFVHKFTQDEKSSDEQNKKFEKFDIIILSDLVFNITTHRQMLQTVKACSIPNHTEIYLTYSHHRPHKKEAELKVFDHAKDLGIEFELIFIERFGPMFENDPGDLEERAKVWMWKGKCSDAPDQ